MAFDFKIDIWKLEQVKSMCCDTYEELNDTIKKIKTATGYDDHNVKDCYLYLLIDARKACDAINEVYGSINEVLKEEEG